MSRENDIKLIQESTWFDADWYLEINQDVAGSGINPAVHYYDYGAKEKRNPSLRFDTTYYITRYSKLFKEEINPLVHFITEGIEKNLSPLPDKFWLFHNEEGNRLDYMNVASSGLFDEAWYRNRYMIGLPDQLDALTHFLVEGFLEGYSPGPSFDLEFYTQKNRDVARSDVNPLIHYINFGIYEGRLPQRPICTLKEYIASAMPQRRPFNVYNENCRSGYIYLFLESLKKSTLFGGVATALLFATVLAEKLEAPIVLVLKDGEVDLELYTMLLKAHDINNPRHQIEFVLLDSMPGSIPYNRRDLFITTSWWSTCSALNSTNPRQIIYLVQDDERLFYCNGDMRLNAAEVFSNESINYVVNTEILHRHLCADPAVAINERTLWFEPAFPTRSYFAAKNEIEKFSFVFYARPSSDRNLFIRGLEAIDQSIGEGILCKRWDITFLGTEIPRLKFEDGRSINIEENLSWDEYLRVVRQCDLGLSLMYTPHPSYPPIDIVACGGIAITNRYQNKIDLDKYSHNIICSPTDLVSIVGNIKKGVEMIYEKNDYKRRYSDQKLFRSWYRSFEKIVSSIEQIHHEL